MATWQPARRRPSNTMGTPRSRSHARARNTSSSVPTSNAKWLRLLADALCPAADQRDAVVVRIEPQEDHPAGHHAVRIAVAHLEAEHLGVEAHRRVEVGDVEDHVSDLSKLKRRRRICRHVRLSSGRVRPSVHARDKIAQRDQPTSVCIASMACHGNGGKNSRRGSGGCGQESRTPAAPRSTLRRRTAATSRIRARAARQEHVVVATRNRRQGAPYPASHGSASRARNHCPRRSSS